MLGTTSGTITDATLRNVRVLVNGAQVGSTTDVPFAASFAAASGTSFTTNFYVVPGTPVAVELRGDVVDSEDNGADNDDISAGTLTAIQATLVGGTGTNNGVPQASLTPINVPSASNVTANSLTVSTGSMSVVELASYPDQTIVVPQSAVKLGAWTLNGSSAEAINVNTFEIDFTGANSFTVADLSNVYIKYGSSTSSIKGTVSAADNTWSQSFSLAANQSMAIELWGTVGSDVSAGATHTMTAFLRVTGVTAQSGLTRYADEDTDSDNTDAGMSGQTITSNSGSVTEAIDASSPVTMLTEDNKTITAAAYKFTAANDTFVIDEVNVNLAAATTVTSVVLKDGNSVLGTRAGATDVTFSGLSVTVPANTVKVLTVDLVLATAGTSAGTSGEAVTVTLDHYWRTNSSGTRAQDTDNVDAAAIYVFASVPTVSEVAIPNVDPSGTVDVAKFTVASTGGTISIKQLGFAVVVTEGDADATLTAGTFKLFRDGTDITDQVGIVNVSGATIESTNTLAEGTTAAYALFATEETISSTPRTYTLRSTLGGAWEAGDSIRVELNADASVANTISYLDGVAGTSAAVAELVDVGGTSDTGVLNFIWSDVSAIPHDTTVVNDTVPTSSGDWNNGFLVKNLPITSWTLTY
jgi:hypothetical protein